VRYCFLLQVRPELLDEYKERHLAVWPDMLRALQQAGWERYSLFARPDGLIVGYVEAEDLDAAQHTMAATDANTRWQSEMRRYFASLDDQAPGGTMVLLEPIFSLDDQLATADGREPPSFGEGAPHS
jgi:L-rhamnose mutarotase